MRTEEQERKARGQRGKYAESKVQAYLKELGEEDAHFDWARIYDARSAGGRFPSRPGDFEFYRLINNAPTHGLIEVKEVDHEFRLPAANFKRPQIANLRKRQLAGGRIVCLVYHTPTAKWRMVPLAFLAANVGPSWDLREWAAFDSVETIFASIPELGMK